MILLLLMGARLWERHCAVLVIDDAWAPCDRAEKALDGVETPPYPYQSFLPVRQC